MGLSELISPFLKLSCHRKKPSQQRLAPRKAWPTTTTACIGDAWNDGFEEHGYYEPGPRTAANMAYDAPIHIPIPYPIPVYAASIRSIARKPVARSTNGKFCPSKHGVPLSPANRVNSNIVNDECSTYRRSTACMGSSHSLQTAQPRLPTHAIISDLNIVHEATKQRAQSQSKTKVKPPQPAASRYRPVESRMASSRPLPKVSAVADVSLAPASALSPTFSKAWRLGSADVRSASSRPLPHLPREQNEDDDDDVILCTATQLIISPHAEISRIAHNPQALTPSAPAEPTVSPLSSMVLLPSSFSSSHRSQRSVMPSPVSNSISDCRSAPHNHHCKPVPAIAIVHSTRLEQDSEDEEDDDAAISRPSSPFAGFDAVCEAARYDLQQEAFDRVRLATAMTGVDF